MLQESAAILPTRTYSHAGFHHEKSAKSRTPKGWTPGEATSATPQYRAASGKITVVRQPTVPANTKTPGKKPQQPAASTLLSAMPQPEPVSEDRQSQNRHPRQRLEPRTPTAIPAAANGLLNSCNLSPATVMSSQGMAVKDWRISTHHNRTEMIHRERAAERPAQPNPGRSWRSPAC